MKKALKISIWVIVGFVIIANLSKLGDTTVKDEVKQDKIANDVRKKYADYMEYLYGSFYTNYSSVECNTVDYKGYIFIRCFQNENATGGTYVVDFDQNNTDSFIVYTINGKAKQHRDTMIKQAGDLAKLKELKAPYPSWIDIGEINELATSKEDYKGEYVKESLFKPEAQDEVKEPLFELNEANTNKIVKQTSELTFKFLQTLKTPYQNYMTECLDRKLPWIPVINNQKCSFYEQNKDYYGVLKDDIKGGISSENIENLDRNYHDAMIVVAGIVENHKIGDPKMYAELRDKIYFPDKITNIKIDAMTGNVKVYYSLSNIKDLVNEREEGYYKETLHDGVLYFKCDYINSDFECKILPEY